MASTAVTLPNIFVSWTSSNAALVVICVSPVLPRKRSIPGASVDHFGCNRCAKGEENPDCLKDFVQPLGGGKRWRGWAFLRGGASFYLLYAAPRHATPCWFTRAWRFW